MVVEKKLDERPSQSYLIVLVVEKEDLIIIMTARPWYIKRQTLDVIESHGLRYDMAIFGIHHGERIVVNDNKPGGLQTAIAWNVKRNKGYN